MKNIPNSLLHDAGAYARCSYCGRYSDDPKTLGPDHKQPACECGRTNGWCGSFVPPGEHSKWSEARQIPRSEAQR